MGTRDPRIDAYITSSADFARPILSHLRHLVHAACPDVDETIKWGFPHFMYQGMLCSMAAFKQHCAFNFWKGALVLGASNGAIGDTAERAMGQFGRITALSDLPSKKVLTGYIKKAMRLNEAGVASPTRSKPKAKQAMRVPADLAAALEKNGKARTTFENFPPSQKREYIDWITEAKRDDTRKRRLTTAIEWMAEGKTRNWKYVKA